MVPGGPGFQRFAFHEFLFFFNKLQLYLCSFKGLHYAVNGFMAFEIVLVSDEFVLEMVQKLVLFVDCCLVAVLDFV